MKSFESLVAENVELLRTTARVAARLDAHTYAAPIPGAVSSGAGAHVRHCLDFYDCLLAGIPEGRVDYNRRERDERTAAEPAFAVRRLRATALALERLDTPSIGGLLVLADGVADAADPSKWGRSSPSRELQFLLSHTTHHLAIVAILLRLRGVEPGHEFGVAPSTLRHLRTAS